jgi:hypothetical protein
MPKLAPLPGTVTREVAARVLIREKVITSSPMLTKLKGVERVVPQGKSHGFYRESELLAVINTRRTELGLSPLTSIYQGDLDIAFRQAHKDDMTGVYNVAHKLFGHTTGAATRVQMLEACPTGNVVVTDGGLIVGFCHIYPLIREPLMQFLNGEFRGNGLGAVHIDPFYPGKVVNVLIKSMGTYHDHLPINKRYSQALFLGLRSEVVRWGENGYIIEKIYATSETPSGLELAMEFQMQPRGRIPGTRGKRRYAFELDPRKATHPIIKAYCKGLDSWIEQHPQEYKVAWSNHSAEQGEMQ